MSNVESLRDAVTQICLALPEVTAESRTGQHSAFTVRSRKFAYFLVDHHGDGRVAICCKVPEGMQQLPLDSDEDLYFNPPYLGPRGWIGVDLGAPGTDWAVISNLLRESYRLVAPKTLAAAIAAD